MMTESKRTARTTHGTTARAPQDNRANTTNDAVLFWELKEKLLVFCTKIRDAMKLRDQLQQSLREGRKNESLQRRIQAWEYHRDDHIKLWTDIQKVISDDDDFFNDLIKEAGGYPFDLELKPNAYTDWTEFLITLAVECDVKRVIMEACLGIDEDRPSVCLDEKRSTFDELWDHIFDEKQYREELFKRLNPSAAFWAQIFKD